MIHPLIPVKSYSILPLIICFFCTFAFTHAHALSVAKLFQSGAVVQRDVEVPVWGWADEGTEVTVSIQGKSATAVTQNGEWKAMLPPLSADENATLVVQGGGETLTFTNVAVGEVWFCAGQSNMGWLLRNATGGTQAIASSEDSQLRYFRVPYRASDHGLPLEGGQWVGAHPDTAGSFSAVAYFYARELRRELGVPVGIIVSELGGTNIDAWTSRTMLAAESPWVLTSWESTKQSLANAYPDLPTPPDVQYHEGSFTTLNELELRYFKGAGRLFGGMVWGVSPFAVRGVIWYQGESDQGQAHAYRSKFPRMIRDWRQHWGRADLPFHFVMLPGYGRPDQGYTYELRDAQFHTYRTVAYTGMAIGVDLGDEREVHPPNKLPLSLRIARLALAETYGFPLTPTGPLYRSVAFSGGVATIEFDYAKPGLVVQGESLDGFLMAGEDRVFRPATAQIVDGTKIVVQAAQVSNPVAVRYAWTNTPRLTLYTAEGLPAAPFRTDTFPLITNWSGGGGGSGGGSTRPPRDLPPNWQEIAFTTTEPRTADAHTFRQSPNTNYAAATQLRVVGGWNERNAYLRFDTPVRGIVVGAKLRLYGGRVSGSGAVDIQALGMNDHSWSESTLTFNNAPAPTGTNLGIQKVNAAGWYEWDVLRYVEDWELSGGSDLLGFALKTTFTSEVNFHSGENQSNQPELVITWVPYSQEAHDDFVAWQRIHFPNAADRENPEIGGMFGRSWLGAPQNIFFYSQGLAPTDPSALRRPEIRDGSFRFPFRHNVPDVAWVVRISTDLADWSEVIFDSRQDDIDVGDDGMAEIFFDGSGQHRLFFRYELLALPSP